MKSFAEYRALRGGKIYPCGVIRISSAKGQEPKESLTAPLSRQNGLKVFAEKLVPLGRGDHFAQIARKGVLVFEKRRQELVATIPFEEFVVVDIQESYVHDDGHLENAATHNEGSWVRTASSLRQAAAGEMPWQLDNSLYVQIDEKYAGQEVFRVNIGMLPSTAMVFTLEGERIPCKCYFPLSYRKWIPKSPSARFGSLSEVMN